MSTRVAAVSYLNARPLFDALRDDARVELALGIPAEVARRFAEGEADVALMPVAAAVSLGDVHLLPDAAIGARGPVRSVAVLSQEPIEQLDTIYLDLSSRTSVVLLRLMLAQRGLSPRLVGLPSAQAMERIAGRTGALLIGDATLGLEGTHPFTFDLAQAWFEHTGLPFVFAGWCLGSDEPSAATKALFAEAKRAGLAQREAFAEAHATAHGLDRDKTTTYLTQNLRYDLGPEEIRGLERFLASAHALGFLPKARVRIAGESKVHPVPSLDTLLSRAAEGERLSLSEGERLYAEATTPDLGLAADQVRKRKHPAGVVTYIVDRNVNYTNVCTTSCRFCAFYRPVGHAEGYVLSKDTFRQKLSEVVQAGGVQILLQGGLNPDLRIEWYEDLFRFIKSEFKLGLHALSPEEILHIAQLESLSVGQVLERLRAAGLDSVPGGGAEILVDRVRRKIAKTKCTSDEWLGVMRTAHHMGLRSSCTMMYGTTDTPRDRMLHLLKLRDLQDETRGFTAFFCWDFQYEEGVRIAPQDTGTLLYLRTQAMARLMLDNVDHVGASWVTQGPAVGEIALRFGADDFGSVMFEENVVSSAGTTFRIDEQGIKNRIRSAGFRAAPRNVAYDWLAPPS
jgi:cyclic dehypoxanthinyl futalosine synthase